MTKCYDENKVKIPEEIERTLYHKHGALFKWEDISKMVEAVREKANECCGYCVLSRSDGSSQYCPTCPMKYRKLCYEGGKYSDTKMHKFVKALKVLRNIADDFQEQIQDDITNGTKPPRTRKKVKK